MRKITQRTTFLLFITLFLTLTLSNYSYSQDITLTSGSTWIVPNGVTQISVEAWGAGGSGGKVPTGIGGSGGGGSGAYANMVFDVVPGESIIYKIGVSSSRQTFFKDSALLLADGGKDGVNIIGGAGGEGGSFNVSKGMAKNAGANGAVGITASSGYGGKGGDAPNGGEGGEGANSSSAAIKGFAPGGGGGGGYRENNTNKRNNNVGGNGMINITYTIKSPEIDVFGILIPIPNGNTLTSFQTGTNFGTSATDYPNGITSTFEIRNTGIAALSISSMQLQQSSFGNPAFTFENLPSFPIVIEKNQKIFIKIKFKPFLPQAYYATVVLNNNDLNEGTYTFKINGLGKRTFLDTDGDGITDNIDIDDDNDGIPDLWEQEFCLKSSTKVLSTYTFLNETFGQGSTKGRINVNIPGATTGYCYEDGSGSNECNNMTSLNDGEYVVTHRINTDPYNVNDPQNIHSNIWYNGTDHTGDEYGRMAVFNADYTPGIFYETNIEGVIPNVPTTYSFWALNIMRKTNFTGSKLPRIKVEFVNTATNIIVHSFTTGDIVRCLDNSNDCELSQWKQFSTEVNLGNVTNFTIRFINQAQGGSGNDLALDDIVITQKYCDTDADGIPDIYDLDSDNDGIADAEEAGFYDRTFGKSFISSVNTTTWIDVNPKNGMHDAIDALIIAGTYRIENLRDTDGDGVPDFLDLDSDNDSLFDIDEAGLINGDGDIDGNGTGDGIDTDKDGILDVFDNFFGFGTVDRTAAQDSNGNGTPDYRSVASINGIMDISKTLYASLDSNGDGKIDGNTDFDKDGILDAFDTANTIFGSPRDLDRKLYLEFDGRNDYAQSKPLLGGLAKSTMMGWIKIPLDSNGSGTIMGQDNFKIMINNGAIAAKVGNTTASSSALDANRWYHVATTFDGTSSNPKLKLYINGNIVATANTNINKLAPSSNKFTLGSDAAGTSSFYKGALDEVRVFNDVFDLFEMQKMIYQEIKDGNPFVRGEIVPKNLSMPWSKLLAYYRMDVYKDNILDDFTTTEIDTGNNSDFMRIYNVKNIRLQQAPMPFQTKFSGELTQTVSQENDVNGQDVLIYPHSILKMDHNITMNGNLSNIGLFVKNNVTYNVENDSKIENSWYLKLDGLINLKGQSQLIQTASSDLDPNSSGWIKRDQQGTTNKYNYNYWSAPVGPRQVTENNKNYAVSQMMKDGTTSTPQDIIWTNGYDGSPTSPITLSSYWIYKFQNVTDAYANWAAVGANGTLAAGQGYTLKGSGAVNLAGKQNYTFQGKPHNGNINNPIAANNINLSGNPYASALDSQLFISDNYDSTDGTLLFWEHAPSNNSHILAQYEGGYATLNYVGGTPPIAPDLINGLGNSSRIPNRFVPVGQGFFITANTTGGQIKFRNSQRAFVKETNGDASNMMFKNTAPSQSSLLYNNAEDTFTTDNYTKLRLGFFTATNFKRELLLGFMDDKADDEINYGYDADQAEIGANDMYFIQQSHKLNIQGVGYFDPLAIYPLGVKISTAGVVTFKLEEAELLQQGANVYLYDHEFKEYHNLLEVGPEINMEKGTYEDRFSLRFTIHALREAGSDLSEGLAMFYTAKNTSINVNNLYSDLDIQQVYLYNMLGQEIRKFETKGKDQTNLIFDTSILPAGNYVIKAVGSGKTVSRKMIVQ